MSFPFHVVIPSRFASTRLPGKPLLEIANKTLLQHVYDSASASAACEVTIATDDERIENAARSFGADVVMTATEHRSGTDRISEVIRLRKLSDEVIIVNVQGDEYGLPAALINQVAMALEQNPQCQMATLCEKIENAEDYENKSVVKVVRDINHTALYFSRSAIPYGIGLKEHKLENSPAYRHIGLYAYRAGFLGKYSELNPCLLEKIEELEQLRVMYNGYSIHVAEAETAAGIGIDTQADLRKVRESVASDCEK